MKNYDILLTPDAIQDLIDIYEYLSETSGFPETAWAYIKKLRQKCYEFRTAPLGGHRRDDLRKNLRIVAVDKNAVIAFEVNEKKRFVIILISFMVAEITKLL